ncbi:MAG: hypothetical protein KC478_12885, partial [Bacteriovoracaceae bacterium]|nr:hypothetical protein [Bacteriovoracaceae bacterium]
LVSKMKNGDNLLVVKKGAVEALNIKTQNKSVAYAGDTLFFLNDGLKFPVSNPELSYKFQQEFDNQAFLDSEMIEEIHNSIALRIDDVKIILMIKDKIVSLDKYYQKKIRSNKQKLAAIPNKMKNFAKEYNKVEKEVQKDIDCLSEGKHCVLKHDSILLKRGMVMTSGRSKINKESIEVLKSYLREFRKEIQRFQKSEQVLSEEIEKQEKWLSLIKKVETNLYPEDESINPELIKEILSLNKEIKDKDLRRYIEMAKWVGP